MTCSHRRCPGIKLVINVKFSAGERQLLLIKCRAQNSKGSDRLLSFFMQPENTASNFPKVIYLVTLLQDSTVSALIWFLFKRLGLKELCRIKQLLTDHLVKALSSKTHLNSRHLVISFCRCITSYNRFWSCR